MNVLFPSRALIKKKCINRTCTAGGFSSHNDSCAKVPWTEVLKTTKQMVQILAKSQLLMKDDLKVMLSLLMTHWKHWTPVSKRLFLTIFSILSLWEKCNRSSTAVSGNESLMKLELYTHKQSISVEIKMSRWNVNILRGLSSVSFVLFLIEKLSQIVMSWD